MRAARCARCEPGRLVACHLYDGDGVRVPHDGTAGGAQVTKVFGGGVVRQERRRSPSTTSRRHRDGAADDHAIVGESGSGKTTLARLLLGLIAPTSGEVLYRGKDLQKLSARRTARVSARCAGDLPGPVRGLQPVLQGRPRPRRRRSEVRAGDHHAPKRAAMMEETLRAVGLRPEETLGRYPHQFSGGQRQRIMVARALLLRPRLIIADEPVSMVDASLARDHPGEPASAEPRFRHLDRSTSPTI